MVFTRKCCLPAEQNNKTPSLSLVTFAIKDCRDDCTTGNPKQGPLSPSVRFDEMSRSCKFWMPGDMQLPGKQIHWVQDKLSQHVSHHNYQTQRNPRIEDMGMNQNIWCLQNGIRLDLKPKSPEKFVAAFNRFPHRQDLTGAPRKWPWEVHTAHSWHSVTGTACATSRCWTTTSLTAHRGPLGSLVMPRANEAETIYCQLTWTNDIIIYLGKGIVDFS